MFALAGPMVFLFFVAVGIAWLNDWRRARRDGTAGLDDDEASGLDDAPGLDHRGGLTPGARSRTGRVRARRRRAGAAGSLRPWTCP